VALDAADALDDVGSEGFERACPPTPWGQVPRGVTSDGREGTARDRVKSVKWLMRDPLYLRIARHA